MGWLHLAKLPLSISRPSLFFQANGSGAEFLTANNTDQPASATVQVIFGFYEDGGTVGDMAYEELKRTDVPVVLAPREQKSFRCNFVSRHPRFAFPNTAQAEVSSYLSQVPDT